MMARLAVYLENGVSTVPIWTIAPGLARYGTQPRLTYLDSVILASGRNPKRKRENTLRRFPRSRFGLRNRKASRRSVAGHLPTNLEHS